MPNFHQHFRFKEQLKTPRNIDKTTLLGVIIDIFS